jgi:hypothetical protein
MSRLSSSTLFNQAWRSDAEQRSTNGNNRRADRAVDATKN